MATFVTWCHVKCQNEKKKTTNSLYQKRSCASEEKIIACFVCQTPIVTRPELKLKELTAKQKLRQDLGLQVLTANNHKYCQN